MLELAATIKTTGRTLKTKKCKDFILISLSAFESTAYKTISFYIFEENLRMLPINPKSLSAQIGFITYHRTLQFYMIPEGASQASQLVVGKQIRLLMKCQK